MDKLKQLEACFNKWSSCARCPSMVERRTQVVFGAGKADADIMIIGEAPGKKEDEVGFPFVGPAGELLMSVMRDVGLSRDDVYITNAVACLPLADTTYAKIRPPTKEELAECRQRLFEEIYIVDPKVIVLLGGTAVSIIRHGMTITKAIQDQPFYLKVPGKITELEYFTLVSWHPSYILRKGGYRQGDREGSELTELRERLRLAVEVVEAAKETRLQNWRAA